MKNMLYEKFRSTTFLLDMSRVAFLKGSICSITVIIKSAALVNLTFGNIFCYFFSVCQFMPCLLLAIRLDYLKICSVTNKHMWCPLFQVWDPAASRRTQFQAQSHGTALCYKFVLNFHCQGPNTFNLYIAAIEQFFITGQLV